MGGGMEDLWVRHVIQFYGVGTTSAGSIRLLANHFSVRPSHSMGQMRALFQTL